MLPGISWTSTFSFESWFCKGCVPIYDTSWRVRESEWSTLVVGGISIQFSEFHCDLVGFDRRPTMVDFEHLWSKHQRVLKNMRTGFRFSGGTGINFYPKINIRLYTHSPMNVRFWVIRLIFYEGNINWNNESTFFKRITLISFFLRRVSKDNAFFWFYIQFT